MNGTNKRLCRFGCGMMTQHSSIGKCIASLKTANTMLERNNRALRKRLAESTKERSRYAANAGGE